MPKYKVKRAGLYFRVNGRLQQLSIGHELTLSYDQGFGMVKRGFVEGPIEVEKKLEEKKPQKRKRKTKKKDS